MTYNKKIMAGVFFLILCILMSGVFIGVSVFDSDQVGNTTFNVECVDGCDDIVVVDKSTTSNGDIIIFNNSKWTATSLGSIINTSLNGTADESFVYENFWNKSTQTIGNISCLENQILRHSQVFDMWYCSNEAVNQNDLKNFWNISDDQTGLTGDKSGSYNLLTSGIFTINRNVSGLGAEINITNQNSFGDAKVSFYNDVGAELNIGVFGHGISQAVYSDLLNPNESAMGLSAINNPMWFATTNNKSFFFGSSPDDDIANVNFSVQIDPSLGGIIFQGNKLIRPVEQEGGFGLFFQSQDVIEEGGFPFGFTARSSNNESIALSWMQNGKNNSFSAQMNTFGAVPKSWVDFGDIASDEAGIEFLRERSSYLNYCDYLQNNLSLIPEGCKYYADTTGRLVPLVFAGDLEVHRSAVIHEGAIIYSNLDYISREDNDMNVIGSDIHVRKEQIVTGNFTNSTQTICNFDAGLCNFVSESIAPEVGRDWQSVNEPECHSDACANSKGGNLKVMCEDRDYTNLENINVSFWLSIATTVNDEFYIELNNNIGTITQVFSETADVDDEYNTFLFPPAFENQSNVTMCVYWDGTSVARESWVDELMYFADLITPAIINQTEQRGAIWLGKDGDDPNKCGVEVFFETNETTQDVQKVLEVGCPTGITRIVGAVEQVDVTIVDKNITGNSAITGNLTVGGTISQNGSTLDETYFKLNGDSVMAGNANFGGFDIFNVGDLDVGGEFSIDEMSVNEIDLGANTITDGRLSGDWEVTGSLDAGNTNITGTLDAGDTTITGALIAIATEESYISLTAGFSADTIGDDVEDAGGISLTGGLGGDATNGGDSGEGGDANVRGGDAGDAIDTTYREYASDGGGASLRGGRGGDMSIAGAKNIRGGGDGGEVNIGSGFAGSYTQLSGDFGGLAGASGDVTASTSQGGFSYGNSDQTSASTNTGGDSGNFLFYAQSAGGAQSAFNGKNLGGKGGDVTFISGEGGIAQNSLTSNIGGDAGSLLFRSGRGGTGATANGVNGAIDFEIGGTSGSIGTLVGTFLNDASGFQQDDNIKHIFGTNNEMSISFDGTNPIHNSTGVHTFYNETGLGRLRALEYATSTPKDKDYKNKSKNYLASLPRPNELLDDDGKIKRGVFKMAHTTYTEKDYDNCWEINVKWCMIDVDTRETICTETDPTAYNSNYYKVSDEVCGSKDVNVTLVDTQAFENTIMISELKAEIENLKSELCTTNFIKFAECLINGRII